MWLAKLASGTYVTFWAVKSGETECTVAEVPVTDVNTSSAVETRAGVWAFAVRCSWLKTVQHTQQSTSISYNNMLFSSYTEHAAFSGTCSLRKMLFCDWICLCQCLHTVNVLSKTVIRCFYCNVFCEKKLTSGGKRECVQAGVDSLSIKWPTIVANLRSWLGAPSMRTRLASISLPSRYSVELRDIHTLQLR